MPRPNDREPLGASIGEIIDRTTKIVHEEIELAKAEIQVALQDLMRGSVAGIVGGVFAFFGLFILLIALSFLVADAIGAWYPWLGFFIVAFVCFIIGGALAFVALKKIKKGSQLAPTQAIDEAKQTRSALQAEVDKDVGTIDAVAVEESVATPVVKPVVVTAKPIETTAVETTTVETTAVEAAAETAGQELEEARDAAVELELDAKEAKRRAKQEAKEAKAAAKEAKRAEAEAAKADAIADKQAKKAAKAAAKAARQGKAAEPAVEEHQAPPLPEAGKDYEAPRPPESPNEPKPGE
jgi:uncharacterized membrane protein YqjE